MTLYVHTRTVRNVRSPEADYDYDVTVILSDNLRPGLTIVETVKVCADSYLEGCEIANDHAQKMIGAIGPGLHRAHRDDDDDSPGSLPAHYLGPDIDPKTGLYRRERTTDGQLRALPDRQGQAGA